MPAKIAVLSAFPTPLIFFNSQSLTKDLNEGPSNLLQRGQGCPSSVEN